MPTDATLPGADDWGLPEQQEHAEPLRYSPDPAYLGDRHFYRVVGWGLVAIVGLALMGSIGLAAFDKEVPEAVIAIGSAAIGALAGVLTVNRR